MPYGSGKEEQCCKLFVGGLSQETTDESMRLYFSTHGNVTDCVVIKEAMTKRSKGFGFVTYETESEADACMTSRPHNLDGKQIDVKRAVSREESLKPGAHYQVKKIFIGGLREGIDEKCLTEFFSEFGNIQGCEIPCNDQNQPKGFGFVTFSDFDVVDKLVAKRYHEIKGVRCEVKKALSKQDMEKAKQQLESKGRRGGSSGGGYERRHHGGSNRDRSNHQSYGGSGGGDYDNGFGSYDGYGGYGNDYGSSWGADQSGYGPMKNSYGSRASGPYGGGYGQGNGYGSYSGYDSGYGTYGQGYGGGHQGSDQSGGYYGYGEYGQNQGGSRGRGRGKMSR